MSSQMYEISTPISDPAHIHDRLAAFYVKISEYRRQDRFTDVKIVCRDGRTFRCHRMALAAASEYFDAMFSTNFLEGQSGRDVHLQNIDSGSFEMILEYVYSGKMVSVDDDNVYPLLFASDFFLMPNIEKHCTHYLTEKNIPMDHALSIYLLASRLGKQTIKSVTGQFILQHLGHFCRDREFLSIPIDELSPVLKNFETLTESKEKALLNVIFQWVSNLTGMGGENMGSCLMELTQQVRFEFMSHWDIETYFNRKIHASRFNLEGDAGMSTDSEDLNFIAEKKELSIHAFYFDSKKYEDQINVYSLRESDEQEEWYVSSSFNDDVSQMRVVEMNGLLYSLKWSDTQGWTFSSSTNIDLRTNLMSLALPLPFDDAPDVFSRENPCNGSYSTVFMRNLRDHVYLFGLDGVNVPFQYYNTERDTWSVIRNVTSNELRPTRMTSDNNNRIYMIMRRGASTVFGAYDPRIGRLEALNFPEIISVGPIIMEDCCFHQNKIYVACIRENDDKDEITLYLSSYDPLADKWNVLDMGSSAVWYDIMIQNLVSDNKKLWMFGNIYNDESENYILSYDSFVQEWDTPGYSARNIHHGAGRFIHAVAL